MALRNFCNGILAAASFSLCLSPLTYAQDNPKQKHLKSDQLVTQAGTENGLGTAAGTHPWHVRAQFERFDEQGKHADSGTFEEWWFGPKSYKSIYTSEGLKQTDVATDAGLFRSGDQRWPTFMEYLIPLLLTDPLSVHPYSSKTNELIDQTHVAGKTKLRCVVLLNKPTAEEHAGSNLNADPNRYPSYCFDADSTVLRLATGGSGYGVTFFNDLIQFQGHVVAREIHRTSNGNDSILIHVLDVGSPPANMVLSASGDSKGPLGGRIELPEGRIFPISGYHEAIQSLMMRADAQVQGEVALKLVVGRDGHVLESTVVSGPPELTENVARFARKMVFEPFTILGSPVEVVTTWKISLGKTASVNSFMMR
jgi:hypothetical protein